MSSPPPRLRPMPPSRKAPQPPADTLLIPIELRAWAVGVDRPRVAKLAVDFTIQDSPSIAWLGQNAEPQPFSFDHAPAQGIHLHWLLPAALRRSRVSYRVDPQIFAAIAVASGLQRHPGELLAALQQASAATRERLLHELERRLKAAKLPQDHAARIAARLAESALSANVFPTVPNRWQVNRWLGKPGAQELRSWVIESDCLWQHDFAGSGDANDLGPQVLHLPAERKTIKRGDVLYRRLGRVFPAGQWLEASAAGDRLKPFTALGYGHPMFASALPHCYNVFGMWDPLADVDDALPAAQVSYTVVGWYSDPADDPVGNAADFGWAWRPGGSEAGKTPDVPEVPAAGPQRIVLRGELGLIDWQRASTAAPQPHRVAVAIGNTGAEALSAAIRADSGEPPASFESYLNVLQLGLVDRLRERHPGGLKEWDQALHRNDFAALPGGPRWLLRPQPHASGSATIALPAALALLLARLNDSQESLNRSERTLLAEREQLFADWANHLADKHTQRRSAADSEKFDGRRNIGRARLTAGIATVTDAAADAARALRQRDAARRALLEDLRGWRHGSGYQLQSTAGPRFWQPSEPVVLVWGDDVRQAPAFDGACRLVPQALARAPALASVPGSAAADPWRPLMLAWEVSYQPDLQLAPLATTPPRYLADRFPLDPADSNDLVDLRPDVATDALRFSGMAPLTGAATTNLIAQAKRYIASYPAAAGDEQQAEIERAIERAIAQLEQAPIKSQALGGFNDALLGRRQSLELPVLDPHAAHQTEFMFGLDVGRAVAGGNARGCVPQAMFNPLRAGHLRLTRLWLIDSFGRMIPILREADAAATGTENADPENAHRLTPQQVIRAERLAPIGDLTGRCSLRPRIIAPARLAFRWRSAVDDRVDSDHDPATSPIVGWLLADHLDNSLAVYAPDGTAVGSLNMDGALWRGPPGPTYGLRIDLTLPDGPLRQLVDGLISVIETTESRAYLQSLLAAIDDMTAHILPNQQAQHSGLALLIGRPLAIVRATLDLDLATPAPLDQRIDAFAAALDDRPRNAGGLRELLVPVKLGHRAHLDDGLVGYFVGPSQETQTYAEFYVEQFDEQAGGATQAPRVRHPAGDQLAVSAAGAPLQVTMLIDPRSPVHATTGILPTKAIDLPGHLYTPALSRMAVTFPIGPVIGPRDVDSPMPLPTPEEPGYQWGYVQPAAAQWLTRPVVPLPPAAAALPAKHDLFDGWLLLTPEAKEGGPDAG